jgi:hypothetical protein
MNSISAALIVNANSLAVQSSIQVTIDTVKFGCGTDEILKYSFPSLDYSFKAHVFTVFIKGHCYLDHLVPLKGL